jgi:hypothetical protein
MDCEYYEVTIGNTNYILHKSCISDGKYFSNAKYVYKSQGFVALEKRCNLIDKITENINLPIHFMRNADIYNDCDHLYLNTTDSYMCYRVEFHHKTFKTYEELYDYTRLNHPHLIKSHDIKIALKD